MDKNKLSSNVLKPKVPFYCLRYAGDIFIFGHCSWLQLKQVQLLLVEFLSLRGLSIYNSGTFLGKVFAPGQQFSYLGFSFIFPDYVNSLKLEYGKYTKLRYTVKSVGASKYSLLQRSSAFLLIERAGFKRFKIMLKRQLSRANSGLSVGSMIDKVNLILKSYISYFLLTSTIRIQLMSINNLVYRLFYSYLLRKFSSTPRVYSYIKKHFIENNRFKVGSHVLLRVHDIKPRDGLI